MGRSWLFLVLALPLGGCATLPGSPRWGAAVTVTPGWARVRAAAYRAVADPWVWGPAAGAAVLQIGHLDHRISRWGRNRTPLFGSRANATRWSYRLRSASVGVDIATILFAPSGPMGGEWLWDKAKGYLVNLVAATAAVETGTGLQHAITRERPNRANDHSFPSDHATTSSVYTRLATLNLEQIPMGRGARDALDVALHGLSFATSWARVEGGWHYPSDTLAGMALGNFFADFFTGSFMGFEPGGAPALAVHPVPGGGEVTFSLALRG
jgi:membrane-associated phospholipid phosphatase